MLTKTDYKSMLMRDAEWCNRLGFNDFDGLNKLLRSGRATQLVNLCEARHEAAFSHIAEDIVNSGKKVVLLAGPSSSGKTSTSLRVALQCKVHGLNPRTVELDNYFVDRSRTPKQPNGEYDYECLEAMNVELLNEHINRLLKGEKVELPYYDFKSGSSLFQGDFLQLKKDDVLILEGIHALDPAMTPNVPEDIKYHLYVSDISSLTDYDPTMDVTDNRLIRRIARDSQKRGISPATNIMRWPDVRAGEEKYIFPFQERADSAFNSTVAYEFPLLKLFVTPLLLSIEEESPAWPTAQRLLNFLNKIDALPLSGIEAIPGTSVMGEFTGVQYLARNLM